MALDQHYNRDFFDVKLEYSSLFQILRNQLCSRQEDYCQIQLQMSEFNTELENRLQFDTGYQKLQPE